LRSVEARMPATIGHGRRKRAARTRERSWVLSPISASATRPVETRNAVRYESKTGVRDEISMTESLLEISSLTPVFSARFL
jgi:hypothetical protein